MSCCDDDACDDACAPVAPDSPRWRLTLWLALAINAAMFLIEIVAGTTASSASLQADAIDFLGDAANYAISLGVAGMALTWRARAAAFKGWSIGLLGAAVLALTIWRAYAGSTPVAETMGAVAILALLANGAVALLLYCFRHGDSNMRSVWICSRNDVIGNLAVLAAAFGVFGTRTAWPDLIVAAVMAALGISGGWQIVRHARADLHRSRVAASPVR